VRSQIRFNTDVTLIDRKIAATLTKNRLNANRRETLDRRLSYLSPEDRARWLKIEQELFDVQDERQSAPVKQAEEVAQLEQAVADAQKSLADAHLRHQKDFVELIQKGYRFFKIVLRPKYPLLRLLRGYGVMGAMFVSSSL
jgi:hypothetical protein